MHYFLKCCLFILFTSLCWIKLLAQEWDQTYYDLKIDHNTTEMYLSESADGNIWIAYEDILHHFDSSGNIQNTKQVQWNSKDHLHKIVFGDTIIMSVFSGHYNDYINQIKVYNYEGVLIDSFEHMFYGRIRDCQLLDDTSAVFLIEDFKANTLLDESIKIVNLNTGKRIDKFQIANTGSYPNRFFINEEEEYICWSAHANFTNFLIYNDEYELTESLHNSDYNFYSLTELPEDNFAVYGLGSINFFNVYLLFEKDGTLLKEVIVPTSHVLNADTGVGFLVDSEYNDGIIFHVAYNSDINTFALNLICLDEKLNTINHGKINLFNPQDNLGPPIKSNIIPSIDGGFILGTSFKISKDESYLRIIKINSECDLEETNSVESLNENRNLKIVPNPSDGNITIHHSLFKGNTIGEVKIIDLAGSLVQKNTLVELNQELDLTSLNSGIYFMEIVYEGNYIVEKLIIH